MERLHAIVHGRVQGVNFRANTQREAERLQLTGWVRNKPEGTVEVVAEGERDRLEKLLDFLQNGPSVADVDTINTTWQAASDDFDGFNVRT
jgi:acylphosphatase